MLTRNVVPDFTAQKVAVVGDLLADHSLFARPTRLSREAPVMILRHEREEISAGGAANVARNLWSLGAKVFLAGAIGRDSNGRELLRILDVEEVDVERVSTVPEYVTPTKTRVLGSEPGRTPQQVVRIDREPDQPFAPEVRRRVAEAVGELAGKIDALLISDYGYGLLAGEVAEAARRVQAAGAIVVVDPRRDFEPFSGVTAFTPNLAELAGAVGAPLDALRERSELAAAAAEFLARYRPEMLLVTLGSRGMALFTAEHPGGVFVRPAGPEQIVDVTGAGDTAAAVFTLSLASGLEGPRAMRIANAASGIVVMQHGAAVCSLSRLRSELPNAPQPEVTETSAVG